MSNSQPLGDDHIRDEDGEREDREFDREAGLDVGADVDDDEMTVFGPDALEQLQSEVSQDAGDAVAVEESRLDEPDEDADEMTVFADDATVLGDELTELATHTGSADTGSTDPGPVPQKQADVASAPLAATESTATESTATESTATESPVTESREAARTVTPPPPKVAAPVPPPMASDLGVDVKNVDVEKSKEPKRPKKSNSKKPNLKKAKGKTSSADRSSSKTPVFPSLPASASLSDTAAAPVAAPRAPDRSRPLPEGDGPAPWSPPVAFPSGAAAVAPNVRVASAQSMPRWRKALLALTVVIAAAVGGFVLFGPDDGASTNDAPVDVQADTDTDVDQDEAE